MKFLIGFLMALVLSCASLTVGLESSASPMHVVPAYADGFDDFGGGNYPMPPGYDLPGVQQMAQAFYYVFVATSAVFIGAIGIGEFFSQPTYDFGGGGSW